MGTAQFSADLEKKKVISSRDKLGFLVRAAHPSTCPVGPGAMSGGTGGVLAPIAGGAYWGQQANWRVWVRQLAGLRPQPRNIENMLLV